MKISLNELRKIVRSTITEALDDERMARPSMSDEYAETTAQRIGSAAESGYMSKLGYWDADRQSFVAGKVARDLDPALADSELLDGPASFSAYADKGDVVIDLTVLFGAPGSVQSGEGRTRETIYLKDGDPILARIRKAYSEPSVDGSFESRRDAIYDALDILAQNDLIPIETQPEDISVVTMGMGTRKLSELVR